MAQGIKTAPEQRARIVALLRQGKSRNEVARLTGCATGTVTTVARQEGVGLDRARTERITAAAREFNQAARLEMINLAAERVREMLEEGTLTPGQLKDVVLTGAILMDKRRQEEAVMGRGSQAPIVHLFIPDDGRLDPATLDEPYRSRMLQLPAQAAIDDQAEPASVTVHPGPLTSAAIDDLLPPEPGETRFVVPSNGRGPIPAGAITVHRSFPGG